MWERSSSNSHGYHWAGAVVIGDYLVYDDEGGNLISVDKLTGATIEDRNVTALLGIPISSIRSSVSHSAESDRVLLTVQDGYVCALGFNADDGTFDNGDKWAAKFSDRSTSTPAVCGGKIYVGSGAYMGAPAGTAAIV
jgi:outer membrane protein assembly factor BamB